MKRAEEIRVAGENHRFTVDGQSFRKSVSIAEWDRSESNDVLFARTDQALLQAKQSGRNRVAVAERDGAVTF